MRGASVSDKNRKCSIGQAVSFYKISAWPLQPIKDCEGGSFIGCDIRKMQPPNWEAARASKAVENKLE